MSDFLTNLSQRVLGTAPLIRPRFPSLFAPQGGTRGDFAGSESEVGSNVYGANDPHESAVDAPKHWSAGEIPGGDRDDLHSVSPADRPHNVQDRTAPVGPPRNVSENRGQSLLPPTPESRNDPPPSYRERGGEETRTSSDTPLLAPDHVKRTGSLDEGSTIKGGISPFDSDSAEGRRGENRSEEPAGNMSEGSATREAERNIRWSEEESVERTGRITRNDGPPRLVPPVPGESPNGENRGGWIEERESDRRGGEAFAQRLRSSSDVSIPDGSVATTSDSSQRISTEEDRSEYRDAGKPHVSARSRSDGQKLLVPEQTTRAESEERFSPPAIPRNESRREGAPSRTINVTIGRVEVRGTPEPKVRQAPARSREKAPASTPVMSLDDYLKRYNGREG